MLSCFPHLTSWEFEDGCNKILKNFHCRSHAQKEWLSIERIAQSEMRFFRITKALLGKGRASRDSTKETELDDFEEHDEEALSQVYDMRPMVNFDIILSPTYRVPVLYISISDREHRFPPSMTTLYEHLVPPQFKHQAEAVGVIGGITITDHPLSNRPVFFIHPCRTAETMEASVGKEEITAEEYLMIWIGALGKCVGLDVPLALVQTESGS